MHDKLFSLEASYNSPEVIKAFTKLKEWVSKGYFNDGFISLDPNQAFPLLQQDKAAMIFQGPWIEDQNIIASHEDPNNYVPIIASRPEAGEGFRFPGAAAVLDQVKARPTKGRAFICFLHNDARSSQATHRGVRCAKRRGRGSAARGPSDHHPNGEMAPGRGAALLPTDQALPQELVNAFFQAQDSLVLGTITPEAAVPRSKKPSTSTKLSISDRMAISSAPAKTGYLASRTLKSAKASDDHLRFLPWLFLAPALAIYSVVVLYPMVYSAWLSLFGGMGITH